MSQFRFNVFTGKFDLVNSDEVLQSLNILLRSQRTTGIKNGSQTIDPAVANYVLAEDGSFLLDEDGNKILVDASQSVVSYVLDENGGYLLDEDGNKILSEDSQSSSAAPIGSLTPLSRVSIPCTWVNVTAKTNNTKVIWVGGIGIEENLGNSIYALGGTVHYPCEDLSDVYILGQEGEGVTFSYGTTILTVLENTDGSVLKNTDGSNLENT